MTDLQVGKIEFGQAWKAIPDFTSVIKDGLRVSHSKKDDLLNDMELIRMLLDRYMKLEKADDSQSRLNFTLLHTAWDSVGAYIEEKKERSL